MLVPDNTRCLSLSLRALVRLQVQQACLALCSLLFTLVSFDSSPTFCTVQPGGAPAMDQLDSLSTSQREAVASFQAITNTDELDTAITLLQSANWNLEVR